MFIVVSKADMPDVQRLLVWV